MTIWTAPTELPDLRRVGVVSIDTETLDRGLQADRGSSWPWGDGHVCGISVAWREGGDVRAIYIPIRHPNSANFPPEQVFRWLKEHIAAGVRFVTLNGGYDWPWLAVDLNVAMPPSSQLEEVGALAALVDENQLKYSLEALCGRYGLPGKDETLLNEAAQGFAVGRKKVNAKAHIWEMPARFVGPYAETDAVRTLELLEKLNPIIEREGTRDAYRLECDLMPLTIAMRRKGSRVDQSAAEQGRDYCLQKRDRALDELSEQHGAPIGMAEINSSDWKIETFKRYNIISPRTTTTGKPSFAAGKTGWMGTHTHWLPSLIATASKYDAAACRYLQGHILDHIIGGRIYSEIHPFRSEDGGAKSLRISYSDPPLQQMPVRDPEIGPLIRRVFLPDEGEVWAKPDVSQQEFRMLVHFAEQHNLPGAKEAGDNYRNNPKADYHKFVADWTALDRDTLAKPINFLVIYGGGANKIAEMTGMPPERAQAIMAQYHARLPFVKKIQRIYQNQAERTGITTLYGGAKRHWSRYAVPGISGKDAGPCNLDEARRRVADPEHRWFGQLPQRYKTYTALNALIQGSSAVHTKLWMLACWREGIVPLVQMHDALESSVATREQGEMIARLGCEAVKLSVPMRVDLKFGSSWGDAKHSWEELTGAPTLKPGHAPKPAPKPKPEPEPAPKPAPAPRPEPAHKPAAVVSQRPAPEPAPKPTPPAPASPEPPAVPAARRNGADIRTVRPAQSSIAFPAFDVREVTTIDLAELIDESVPEEPQDLLPLS
jgi:DNA polymerase-1